MQDHALSNGGMRLRNTKDSDANPDPYHFGKQAIESNLGSIFLRLMWESIIKAAIDDVKDDYFVI